MCFPAQFVDPKRNKPLRPRPFNSLREALATALKAPEEAKPRVSDVPVQRPLQKPAAALAVATHTMVRPAPAPTPDKVAEPAGRPRPRIVPSPQIVELTRKMLKVAPPAPAAAPSPIADRRRMHKRKGPPTLRERVTNSVFKSQRPRSDSRADGAKRETTEGKRDPDRKRHHRRPHKPPMKTDSPGASNPMPSAEAAATAEQSASADAPKPQHRRRPRHRRRHAAAPAVGVSGENNTPTSSPEPAAPPSVASEPRSE